MFNWYFQRRALHVLRAIAAGALLRSHRDIEGQKVNMLHMLDSASRTVHPRVVTELLNNGYVTSNQKFPVATLMISDKGRMKVGH